MSARSKRIVELLNDCGYRNRLVGDGNLLDQDELARVGGADQQIKVLKEINGLQELQNESWNRGSV